MKPNYIVKDNEIYKISGDKEAVKIEINNGVIETTKETVKYDKTKDFAYSLFEIKAKFSKLFEPQYESIENEDEYLQIIEEKDATISKLNAKIKELEEIIENLTKELEEIKASKETENKSETPQNEDETEKDAE